jgi:hypothetical protein
LQAILEQDYASNAETLLSKIPIDVFTSSSIAEQLIQHNGLETFLIWASSTHPNTKLVMEITAAFIPTSTGHKYFRKCVRFIEQYIIIVGKDLFSRVIGPTNAIANILQLHIDERFKFISASQSSSGQEGDQKEQSLQDGSQGPLEAKSDPSTPAIAREKVEIHCINDNMTSKQRIIDISPQNYDTKPDGLQQNVPKVDAGDPVTKDSQQGTRALHKRASPEDHTWEYLVYEADEEEWFEWHTELQQVIIHLLNRYRAPPLPIPKKVISGWKRVNHELDDKRNNPILGGFPEWEEPTFPEPPVYHQPQPESNLSSFTQPPGHHSSLSQSSLHPYFGPHLETPRIDITITDQHDIRVESSPHNDEENSGIRNETENELPPTVEILSPLSAMTSDPSPATDSLFSPKGTSSDGEDYAFMSERAASSLFEISKLNEAGNDQES